MNIPGKFVINNTHINGALTLAELCRLWPFVSREKRWNRVRHGPCHSTRQCWCPSCWGLKGLSPVSIHVRDNSGPINMSAIVDIKSPVGLLSYFEGCFPGATFVDMRNAPSPSEYFAPKLLAQLEPYQIKAINALVTQNNGLLISPTGSGKTLMMLELIARKRPFSCYIISPTIEIVNKVIIEQAKTHFSDFPVIKGGSGPGIHVMTHAAFRRLRPKQRELDVDMIVVDEAHKAGAIDLYKQLMRCSAYYRYGFTATPSRTDHRWPWVIGALGPIIHMVEEENTRERTAEPLAALHVIETSCSSTSLMQLSRNLSHDTHIMQYICKIIRLIKNGQIDKLWNMTPGDAGPLDYRGIMIVVDTIEAAEEISQVLNQNGLNFSPFHAKLGNTKREQVIEALESGQIDGIVCTTIGDEGIDIPGIFAIILITGRALGRHRQRIGRATRRKQPNYCQVHDICIIGTQAAKHAIARFRRYPQWGWEHVIVDASSRPSTMWEFNILMRSDGN